MNWEIVFCQNLGCLDHTPSDAVNAIWTENNDAATFSVPRVHARLCDLSVVVGRSTFIAARLNEEHSNTVADAREIERNCSGDCEGVCNVIELLLLRNCSDLDASLVDILLIVDILLRVLLFDLAKRRNVRFTA